METFKVVYINPMLEGVPLTLGKTYQAFSSVDIKAWAGLQIIDDTGRVRTFNKKMFILLDDWRVYQLEKLGI